FQSLKFIAKPLFTKLGEEPGNISSLSSVNESELRRYICTGYCVLIEKTQRVAASTEPIVSTKFHPALTQQQAQESLKTIGGNMIVRRGNKFRLLQKLPPAFVHPLHHHNECR